MGCGASTVENPSKVQKIEKKSLDRRFSSEKGEKVPDPGLFDKYVAVKLLGQGGTGLTWHYKDRQTGEDVAIKLMKRPMPRIVLPSIEREIRVSASQVVNTWIGSINKFSTK
jgi:serine/threonine protein kinase